MAVPDRTAISRGLVTNSIWFVFQLVSSFMSIEGTGGGVAYGAHIGSFIVGVVLNKPFALGWDRRPSPPQSCSTRFGP